MEQWNALVIDNNPLLRHELLEAMEICECVGEKFGWFPRHIAVYDGSELAAAMPLYEKHNSYGEFVFDQSWAEAWERAGRHYFPKLVSAVPYTPAQGQRLLVQQGRESEFFPILQQTAVQLCQQIGYSGVHVLFPMSNEQHFLQQQWFARYDCQFHWHNQGYANFDDFLAALKSKKRKNIRQERRRVFDTGVEFRVLDGHTATAADLEKFAEFYDLTFEEKWGVATFNLAFFTMIAEKLPDNLVLVLADHEGETVAGALMYRSDTTLYGRHWGCTRYLEQLHFETCYYQGIEFCIRHGLKLFEPGAQGEHKVARGFVPTLTSSSHWIASEEFGPSIKAFCEREKRSILHYIGQVKESIPYRETP